MENAVLSKQREEPESPDARKLPIMRALAKYHGCDVQRLLESVEASEFDVHAILREMLSKKEVEAIRGDRSETFSLTLKGWAEYINVLGSIYELA